MKLALNNQQQTMSSIDMVRLINKARLEEGKSELRHDNFMAKLESHPGIDSPKFLGQYQDTTGRTLKCYNLPKREADLMVMAESMEVQARVYDALAIALAQPKALDLSDPETLRTALLTYAERVITLTAKVAEQAPAVEFVERYVESDSGSFGFREVCRVLKVKENDFRAFLHDKGIMYKLGGNWTPYAQHIDAGRFEVKTGTANDHAYVQAKFTAKGVSWVAGEYAKHQLDEVKRIEA